MAKGKHAKKIGRAPKVPYVPGSLVIGRLAEDERIARAKYESAYAAWQASVGTPEAKRLGRLADQAAYDLQEAEGSLLFTSQFWGTGS